MIPFPSPSAGLPHIPPPREDPVCLAGRKPSKQKRKIIKGHLHSVGESRQLREGATSARRAQAGWPVPSAYWQIPVSLAVCKTTALVHMDNECLCEVSGGI